MNLFLLILFLPRAWRTWQSKIKFAWFISTIRGLRQGLSLIWFRVHGICAVVNKQFDFRLILVEDKVSLPNLPPPPHPASLVLGNSNSLILGHF